MSDAHQFFEVGPAVSFILAGNSTFTLRSKKTNTRFTFKVRRPEGKPWFVSILTGSNNETDFTFLGMIFNDRNYVHGSRSKIRFDAESAKAFEWFWVKMNQGQMPASLEIWHEGRCGRCGRTLTVPESIAGGIGPECAIIIGREGRVYGPRRLAPPPVEHDDGTGLEAEMDAMVQKGEEDEERRRMDRKFGIQGDPF